MPLNFSQTRDLLHGFNFKDLFIEQLGWSNPPAYYANILPRDGCRSLCAF
jgi:hypothetical protein